MAGYESTKNSIRHQIYALSKIFGIDVKYDANLYMFADLLEKSINLANTQLNIHGLVSRLCNENPQSDAFIRRYEELRSRNIRELPATVYLLSKLKSDPVLLRFLEYPLFSKTATKRKEINHPQYVGSESCTLGSISIHLTGNNRHRATLSTSDELSLFSTCRLSAHHSLSDQALKSTSKKSVPSNVAPQLPKFPLQPEWFYLRTTLWDDFLSTSLNSEFFQHLPIESLSNAVQEYAVVNDLLQCLQGNQGVYIKPLPLTGRYAVRCFKVDEKMTPTLLDTVNKILPVCSDYSTVARFLGEKSTFEHGMVNQALAGAMRSLLKDYLILICHLEYQYKIGQLGIVKLHFFLQEIATAFSQLTRLANNINTGRCSGGATLSVLYDSLRSVYGVKQLRDLMLYLLRSASMPFFKILQKWIHRGVISDPYKEFFISAGSLNLSDPNISSPSDFYSVALQFDRFTQNYVDWAFFWECHYSLVSINLPSFLESSASKILNTGKYLNVVQQCADSYELPACEEVVYNKEHSVFLDKIDQAHLYASNLLLKLMLQQKDLKEHLKSVKRFFLLDQGDFIVHFMDAAAGELRKNSEVVSQLRLSSLLELALRTSTANADPFKDNLMVVIFQFDLISQILLVLRAGSEDEPNNVLPIEDKNLSGFEAFCLDYRVGWPIDLVLNRQVMDRYQMLFRHLLYCKHVERLLCNSWILGKLARKCDNLMTTWFTTAFLLTQRMLTFIQHFQYYMSVEIIEPAWHNFFKRVDQVSNLDLLLDSHLHFLEVCMDDCLLASPDLLSLVGKISVACVTFANFIQHLAFSTTGVDLSSSGESEQCIIYLSRHSSVVDKPLLHDPTPSSTLGLTINDVKYAPLEPATCSIESMITKITIEEFGRTGLSNDMTKTVANFDANFNRMLVELLEKIKQYAKHQSKLLSLVSRLDFNDFYTQFANSEHSLNSHCDQVKILHENQINYNSFLQTNSVSDDEDYI
ncbi:Gamma-tubulin complex component 2 [Schistosoma japonicum]|nr:Gamma-tubulin complex component 2 [Schistosoma japonicum]